jgi:thioredoxin-related protein
MVNFLKSNKTLFLLLVGISFLFMGFKKPGGDTKGIKWVSFNEAVKLNKEHPKKIFIDVYTSWCGWCKRMDADTYTDATVIDYINKNFYAVRLDAETRDTFQFNNHTFVNAYPAGQRGAVNELASSMLDGKLGYPTTVYFDEKFNRLTYVQSYLAVKDLMPILTYFGEDKYKTMKYDDYKKSLEPVPVVKTSTTPATSK